MARAVLITGTSSGIGHALAEALLARGDAVYALGRSEPKDLESQANFHFHAQDLRQFERIPHSIRRLLEGVSKLDLVVLNAGILGEIKDLRDTTLDELRELMDVNTWANKILLDALFELPIPIAQVVGISSGAAVSGSRGWNGYALSKAAFKMLLQLYAAEIPDTHFCSFAPGLVDTTMQDTICGLPPEMDRIFPTVARLKEARGTEAMPTPETLAPVLLDCFADVPHNYVSGEFVDLRNMQRCG